MRKMHADTSVELMSPFVGFSAAGRADETTGD
jgi:hypothetical protein